MSESKRVNLARTIRKKQVPAEQLHWQKVRRRQLGGFKFRRQNPVGTFVVDFACVECKLIVELDGESHLTSKSKDEKCAAWLEANGWKLVRLWNTQIYDELDAVQELPWSLCNERRRER